MLPAAPALAKEQDTARARSLYVEGVKHQKAGRLAEAQAAFAKAFALKKHYQIAGNLGSVELDLKRYRDAAEHLSWALADIQRESKAATEDVNAIAERLRVAQAKVVTLRLKVRMLGQDHAAFSLRLDGKSIGSSGNVAFMPAGRHGLQALASGAMSQVRHVTAQAGESTDVELNLFPAGAGSAASGDSAAVKASGGRPVWPISLMAPVAGLSLIVAAASWPLSAKHAGKADDLAAQIQADTGKNPHDACDIADGALYDRCNAWRDERANATDTGALALASTLSSVASLAFLVGYVLPQPRPWDSGSKASGAAESKTGRLLLLPTVSSQQAGLQLVGSF